jgi:hypothetical protein
MKLWDQKGGYIERGGWMPRESQKRDRNIELLNKEEAMRSGISCRRREGETKRTGGEAER